MPTLIRFLVTILILSGVVIGAMVGVIALVEPEQRNMSETVSVADILAEND